MSISREDHDLITEIMFRADEIGLISPRRYSRLTCMMDLTAVHERSPLRLADLLAADQFNFVHDVAGIARHMNRDTGELGGCFTPRFSQRQVAA
jgi:hypothetical protein